MRLLDLKRILAGARVLLSRRRIARVLAAAAWLPVCAIAGNASGSLLDDWGDARAQLKARGVGMEIVYTGESATAVSGGARRDSTYLGLAEARLTLEGERLAAWPGATANLHVIRPHGGNPSDDVGDAQGVSNIAAPAHGRILEAWVQQNLLDERLSLLVGRYDLNAEFYQLQTAGLFLNSSFGIGPELAQTGVAGPSLYPDTAVAARVEVRPAPGLHVHVAVVNGVPVGVARAGGGSGFRRSGDGLLFIGEASMIWPAQAAPTLDAEEHHVSGRRRAGRAVADAQRDGKLAFGAWRYRAQLDHLSRTAADGNPQRESGGNGFYIIGEHTLIRDSNQGQRALRAFAQLGFGDEDVARFSQFVGGGLTLTAPFASRPDDEVGIAFASARNGAPYMDAERSQGRPVNRAETTIELTYLAPLNDRLTVQPSLQYVIHPGTDPGLRNATAALLRFEVSL